MESINELRKICQENACRDLYRHVSIYVTKLFLYTPITANQVTLLFIVIGVISVFLFTAGDYWKNSLGAILLIFYHILDEVDGEIARYRRTVSDRGVFLDLIGHSIINTSVFAGIGIGLYRNYQNVNTLFIGFIAVISMGLLYGIRSNKMFILSKKIDTHLENPSMDIKIFTKNKLQIKRLWGKFARSSTLWMTPPLIHLILIFSLMNKLYILLLLYGIITPIWVIYIIYLNIQMLK